MPDPKPERPDLDDYLKCDDIIDFDDPSIEEAVEQLTEGLKDNISKAQAIYEFVRDQIFHSFHINATSITVKASEVIDKGHGTCYAQSHLLAALMRGAGIPAGLCYQIKKDDTDEEKLVVHGYNAVYMEDLERWVRIDASVKPEENASPFNLEQEVQELTLSNDRVHYDDPTVYINPSKRVIKALRGSENIDELRDSLPESI